MGNEKIYQMDFSKVYHLLVNKAEKKGRTKEEVDEIIRWLTGYSQPELEGMLERPVPYGDFFLDAPKLHVNRKLIKGALWGFLPGCPEIECKQKVDKGCDLWRQGRRYRRTFDAGDTLSG